jgi:ATP phosphoribosyltransferase
MSDVLTIALAKGYLMNEALRIFESAGIFLEEDFRSSRKLFTFSQDRKIRFLQVRPWDVPVYVAQGAADLGVVGLDVLAEQQPHVLHLTDLKFGFCKLILAGLSSDPAQLMRHGLRVATKYPDSTLRYFAQKGIKIQLTKLYGAVELGPLTGLSDVICDLTATGKTLAENQLHIIDEVLSSSAYLIANPILYRVHHEAILDLKQRLDTALTA